MTSGGSSRYKKKWESSVMTQVGGCTSVVEAKAANMVTVSGDERSRYDLRRFSTAICGQPNVECRIGSTARELRAAFNLVYEQYLRFGLMRPNDYRMRVTQHHLMSSTEVLVALERGTVTCTMSLMRDEGGGLPMESVYSKELAELRKNGLKLAEVSCLAEKHDPSERSHSAVFQLMPLVAQLAYHRGADRLLIAVHPRHSGFYRRYLGFELIAEERNDGKVCGKPAVALAMRREFVSDHPRLHQWLFGRTFPDVELGYRPLPEGLLEEMQLVVDACREGNSSREQPREMVLPCLAGVHG